MLSYDAAIVGAGPAGLASAIELRQLGASVGVFETSRPPIDKACGEGIMPDGVRRLEHLGVALDGALPLRGIRYLDRGQVAEADFPSRPGLGLRRTQLHKAMAERCIEMAVDCHWATPVTALHREGVETGAGLVRARWIIGADGLRSRVREWAGLGVRSTQTVDEGGRFGVRRHYEIEPWTDRVEVYWQEGAEAYVTPVGPREVGVAILWSGARSKFEVLLERFPDLRGRLATCTTASKDRGLGPLEQRSHSVADHRVALVGDAAGYRDAISGEGLSLGFHQAQEVARAIYRGDLRIYKRANRRLCRVPFLLIRGLLLLERFPRLRSRWMRTLAADQDLFERLVAVHCGELSPARLGAGTMLHLVATSIGLVPAAR